MLISLYKTSSRLKGWGWKILPLLFLTTIFDFVGTALVYPLINILGGKEYENNQILKFLNHAIDGLGLSTSISSLLIYIFTIFVLKAILQVIYRWVASKGMLQWMVSMRSKIYVALFSSRFTTTSEDSSRLTNSLTTQSELAAGAIYQSFQLWQSVLVLFSGIILANLISWKLFIILITVGSILAFLFKATLRLSLQYGQQLTYLNKNLFSIVGQTLNNYRYLKSTFTSNRLFDDFNPIIKNIKKIQVRFTILNAITSSLTEPITIFVISLLFFIGNILGISTDVLIMQALVMYRVFSRAIPVAAELQGFKKSIASLDYVDNILKELNESVEIRSNSPLKSKINKIEIDNISFGYGDSLILRNTNLKIIEPGINLIMGHSGSGKTTLLNLLTYLLKPSEGAIKINNHDLAKINLYDYRSKIGLLGQEPMLFNMTLRENLKFRNNNISDKELIDWIVDLQLTSLFPDKKINLDIEINQMSSNLSGGQKQRLCFIREIVSNPELIILDEPTSALDEISSKILIKKLFSLKDDLIILAISHDNNFTSIADNIYKLENGNLIHNNT